jgi:hypothetical protein
MTCTNQQVKLLMKAMKRYSLTTAAAKAGMSSKTARKYLKAPSLSPALKGSRDYRTRPDAFALHWDEISKMLTQAPELEAKTLLYYLMEHYPSDYQPTHLRTLQRRLQQFRAEHGADKPIIFRQIISPGQSSQSDWTWMNELRITLANQPFSHLLYHFILPYSGWESFRVCASESFDTLSQGYEYAVWELGGTLPTHRTDNLSAATQKAGGTRCFTERWQAFLDHYQVMPTRNNPGQGHENGSVEKSHDTLKKAIEQHLLLRGSRNFADLKEYEGFLGVIKQRRNEARKTRLQEELPYLQALPERQWHDPISLWVRVSPSSIIQILGCTYSVPSRLISYALRVDVYVQHIALWYGQKQLLTMPRLAQGNLIDYRHIIDSLIRKPGAFAHYQYRECLFPSPCYRWAYDQLQQQYPAKGHKYYLQLLQYAKLYGEQQVEAALQLCQEPYQLPLPELIKAWIANPPPNLIDVNILQPALGDYDQLLAINQSGGLLC